MPKFFALKYPLILEFRTKFQLPVIFFCLQFKFIKTVEVFVQHLNSR